jgi:hypothetical protein
LLLAPQGDFMIPLFENIVIGKEITLDIDLFVDDWINLEKDNFINKLKDFEQRFETNTVSHYRESSHKNVHIKIEFNRDLCMLDVILLRAWFDDDRTLLIIDMKRYFKSMDAVNRFMRRFDCKGKINDSGEYEINHAGPWRLLR